jgi:hypothetical protein
MPEFQQVWSELVPTVLFAFGISEALNRPARQKVQWK